MGAVPKHKISTQRKGKRRAAKKLTAKNTVECPQCKEPRLSHQACKNCGFYKS